MICYVVVGFMLFEVVWCSLWYVMVVRSCCVFVVVFVVSRCSCCSLLLFGVDC